MVKRSTRIARANQRGAAVFIVLLVVIMLTGIGVFATRAASLATLSSGFDRQMTQTHYITEYAVLTTTAELSTPRRDIYIRQMAKQPDMQCTSVVNTSTGTAVRVSNATCYRFFYGDLENAMKSNAGEGLNVLVNPYSATPTVQGGGLGFAPLQADFVIEMSDLGPSTPPIAGNDLTSAGAVNLQYMTVTLNTTGQVRPLTTGTTVDPVRGKSASIEVSRAHLVVGPISKL
jgi:hypothetical protein